MADRIEETSAMRGLTAADVAEDGRRRLWGGVGSCVLVLVLALLLGASAARADAGFGIEPGSFVAKVAKLDPADPTNWQTAEWETQLGAHPWSATTAFAFNSSTTLPGFVGKVRPVGSVKDIVVDLPPGFIGNPQAVPQCTPYDLVRHDDSGGLTRDPNCAPASQVGVVKLNLVNFLGSAWQGPFPVYNLRPSGREPGLFGFNFVGIVVTLHPTLRSDGDYGLSVTLPNISQALPIMGTELTLWGVPADPRHDAQRAYDCINSYCDFGASAGVAPRPFLTNPTDCTEVPKTTIHVDSWEHPGQWQSVDAPLPPPSSGCEKLAFHPTIEVQPSTTAASTPAGYTVDLQVPQPENPNGIAAPELKRAVVALPKGVVVNPSAADGLVGCSEQQVGLHALGGASCPLASKIGELTIDTPLLADPMRGSVYLAQQGNLAGAGSNPFGSLLALYLVAQGPGVTVKLAGKVEADPATGQLVATFDDNPQLPFTDLTLTFKAGPRAPLSNPNACGSKTTTTRLVPYGGATATPTSTFTVSLDGRGAACPASKPFKPSFAAGTMSPAAGTFSPFVMRFGRNDGQQALGAINASLPAGLLAILKSVPMCSVARGAAGTCGPESRIGKVTVSAGAGTSPLVMPIPGRPEQSVYLTQPYRKGDVAGMSIVVPAVAGPFNLGTVVTRAFLHLRPKDQGVDVQSDPLPSMLQGIPLQIRQVQVSIDRPQFMFNPTSCNPTGVYGNVFSTSWTKVPVATRFQAAGCGSLPLSPVITVSGGGKGNTHRYTHPALRVTIRQSPGESHLSKTNVVLPKEVNVDLKAPALKHACAKEVYAADKCSKIATVGTVKAITPVFAEPLTGPAFLLQKKGKLPNIVMRLRNSQFSLDLIGVLDFLKDGRLITRVSNIPDAPITSFVLDIKGGKNGSLLNRNNVCKHKRATQATFKGQNGKVVVKTPTTHFSGCPPKATSSRRSSRSAATKARVARLHAMRRQAVADMR